MTDFPMMHSSKIRNHKDLLKDQFNDEQVETKTSIEQVQVEALIQQCYERFEQIACFDHTLPALKRKEHIGLLERSVSSLCTNFECLDSSRPWLLYWILNSASILNFHFSEAVQHRIVEFMKKCQNPEGGFGGGPGQYSHLAPTYAAVNSLIIIGTKEAYEAINRENLLKFLRSVKEPNGAFKMHVDGEVDLRGAYCALSCATLACLPDDDIRDLFKDTSHWITKCQTYEGGFGGTPDLEAHGGYSFCGVAALLLLNTTGGVNLKSLLRWVINRQMRYEGGFQGRTNKLVDGCYSFWQGALVPLVQSLITLKESENDIHIKRPLFDSEALQEYVLICCQGQNGGLIDKPQKPVDLYHTCYCLSGLAIAQHCEFTLEPRIIGRHDNEVIPTHPIYNVPPKAVLQACTYFNSPADFTTNGSVASDSVSDIWNNSED